MIFIWFLSHTGLFPLFLCLHIRFLCFFVSPSSICAPLHSSPFLFIFLFLCFSNFHFRSSSFLFIFRFASIFVLVPFLFISLHLDCFLFLFLFLFLSCSCSCFLFLVSSRLCVKKNLFELCFKFCYKFYLGTIWLIGRILGLSGLLNLCAYFPIDQIA